ncbi:gluconate 2-dehydrogenase subunit 3 family protein [Flavobacteriaceae bacterium]|nr:gluconate 2-dehydrogenase subunit 3 family protein [Flavobacteriaceae bacterium]
MNRRKALKNLGLSLGTITLSPAVLSLLQSCKNDLDWNPVFFNSNQVSIVSELTDLIIPSGDDIPGSKELNLIKFIDLYIYNISNKKEQDLLKKSMDAFLSDCLIRSNKNNVDNLERNDLDSSLEYYFKIKNSSHSKWRQAYNKNKNQDIVNKSDLNEAFSFNFLNTIRQLTITAFKGNEYIGENVLAYVPIPGQQKGCVDLQETTGGKAWSI